MQRCDQFGICADAVYDPASGHIPRGFSGAEGSLDDVLLVMVFAEPGFPLLGESYSDGVEENLRRLLGSQFLKSGENQFHRNITEFLGQVFAKSSKNIEEQLTRVWLTESRNCSLTEEIGNIRKVERLRCASKHLVEQIKLFPNAIVLLAGNKAKQVSALVGNVAKFGVVECGAFAPPGCNKFKVRESHQRAVRLVQEHIHSKTV
jgi:hypothetical protein